MPPRNVSNRRYIPQSPTIRSQSFAIDRGGSLMLSKLAVISLAFQIPNGQSSLRQEIGRSLGDQYERIVVKLPIDSGYVKWDAVCTAQRVNSAYLPKGYELEHAYLAEVNANGPVRYRIIDRSDHGASVEWQVCPAGTFYNQRRAWLSMKLVIIGRRPAIPSRPPNLEYLKRGPPSKYSKSARHSFGDDE